MGIGEFDDFDISGAFKIVNLFVCSEAFKDVKLYTMQPLLGCESASYPFVHIVFSRIVFAVGTGEMWWFLGDLKRRES